MDTIIRLAPLIGPLVAAAVAVAGWFTAHWFNAARDLANKRHEMISAYLLEAYRRLEMAANREHVTDEQAIGFESAIADIQLLGSPAQIAVTLEYVRAYAADQGGEMHPVLCRLRDDLRREMQLAEISSPPLIFRFKRWTNQKGKRT
jgi:hypothetical protein